MNLINKEKTLRDMIKSIGAENENDLLYTERLLYNTVKQQYSEDVRPVVRGKWIIHNEIKNVYGGICIECPKCGEKYVVEYVADEKFCRNCGCDMRETDGEEGRRIKKQLALNELGYPYDLPNMEV